MFSRKWDAPSNGPTSTENLHRNIIFRDSENLPELPYTNYESYKPEDLWDYMDAIREQGSTLLAIPHNANLSNGLMFPDKDSFGNPITREWAEQRMRNEALQEINQIKGASETHPLLSSTDEFANFSISDFLIAGTELGNLRGQPKGSYIRDAYRQGLNIEEALGFNPYKFGIIGSSDTHNSGGPYEEDNYFGKAGLEDGTPAKRLLRTDQMKEMTITWGTGGLAAVWAPENTREAIYDSLARKETFGTSGPRMRVRLFGGWDFTAADANSNSLAQVGYDKGIPMGGDLSERGDRPAPTFLVAAMKDPDGANLDRIQIVKTYEANGQTFEKIYEVALADGRQVNPNTGRVPPVGNSVDVINATYTNDIGDAQLANFWSDPDFDPMQRAVYYARVLEIPTPRWTTYDAVNLGITPPDPATHQERAWTSPIWYTPTEAELAQRRAEALTVDKLEAQGARSLSTGELEALVVGNRVKITNRVSGETQDAYYREDGKRSLSGFASMGGFHTGVFNPYEIRDGQLFSSFDDGSEFSSRVYELDGTYYAARTDEAGYVNYEVAVTDL